ncbi:hypothetical protein SAMN05892877_1012 [Rhizobium subbaraonis]|uniref:Uncharacterized protein n=2 Tax=Rhizobium subbaraonis TaxID=908946 RepID=A0A285TZ91_9HYPH|nr:hypothetical protein SAMN05892877_1012 [Rhizobium subbaraonis]
MKLVRCLLLSAATGLSLPQGAFAAGMVSTYTDTPSCPVVSEGEDAFIRECRGPGSVRVVLQYVDGLFGLFYLPVHADLQLEREDMMEVAASARHPYGAKHEWRLRAGDRQPCAAIIRAYTVKGERLVVTDLSSGALLGRVKTNNQARALADKACASASSAAYAANEAQPQQDAVPASTDRAIVSSETAKNPPTDVIPVKAGETVAEAARRGRDRFQAIYVPSGISGAVEEILRCHAALKGQPSQAALAYCAALDIVAANVDSLMMRQFPDLAQPLLSGTRPDERIAAGVALLGLDKAESEAFDREIAAALGVKPATATEPSAVKPAAVLSNVEPDTPAAEPAPKSVFSFSQ